MDPPHIDGRSGGKYVSYLSAFNITPEYHPLAPPFSPYPPPLEVFCTVQRSPLPPNSPSRPHACTQEVGTLHFPMCIETGARACGGERRPNFGVGRFSC